MSEGIERLEPLNRCARVNIFFVGLNRLRVRVVRAFGIAAAP